ncbi:hypothetical protein VTJ49DRAFT_2183 [Mycothermus thermophilus]|uniref:Uncharacterized protein n=1 Tax=Humicola insolens TaxID=85995 RepID=A0ABR3VBQ8_HUMIN
MEPSPSGCVHERCALFVGPCHSLAREAAESSASWVDPGARWVLPGKVAGAMAVENSAVAGNDAQDLAPSTSTTFTIADLKSLMSQLKVATHDDVDKTNRVLAETQQKVAELSGAVESKPSHHDVTTVSHREAEKECSRVTDILVADCHTHLCEKAAEFKAKLEDLDESSEKRVKAEGNKIRQITSEHDQAISTLKSQLKEVRNEWKETKATLTAKDAQLAHLEAKRTEFETENAFLRDVVKRLEALEQWRRDVEQRQAAGK